MWIAAASCKDAKPARRSSAGPAQPASARCRAAPGTDQREDGLSPLPSQRDRLAIINHDKLA